MARPGGMLHPDADKQRDAVPLGQAIQEILQESGITALMKYPQVAAAWFDIVAPELAARTTISGFRRGCLKITVTSSTALHTLEFQRAEILRKLQQQVKRPFIARISLMVSRKQKDNV